jgi:hypothetical protein
MIVDEIGEMREQRAGGGTVVLNPEIGIIYFLEFPKENKGEKRITNAQSPIPNK